MTTPTPERRAADKLRPLTLLRAGMTARNFARLSTNLEFAVFVSDASARRYLMAYVDRGMVYRTDGGTPEADLFELTADGRAALVAAGLMKPAQQPKKKEA